MRIGKPLQAMLAGLVFLIAIVCAGQAAAQAWSQLAPTGGPPDQRNSHSAVFNPASDRMIVFGGYVYIPGGPPPPRNDVWVLTHADGKGGTPAWTQLAPGGESPAPRYWHSAVFNPASDRMIVFGGCTTYAGCPVSDVWFLTHADNVGGTPTWSYLPTNGTPPRFVHSAVYDVANNTMIVFGGYNGGLLNDTWVLSNADGSGSGPSTWSPLPTTGAPPARYEHSAVYNPATNSMVVFGGYNGDVLNDTWVLSNANGLGSGTPTWTQFNPSGPAPRDSHTAVYDPATNRMIVFGGYSNGNLFNDTWVLSNADGSTGTPAWTQLAPAGTLPAARRNHSAVYNPANNRMIMFGGNDFFTNHNDTWVLTDANGVNLPVAIDIQPGSTANTFSLHPGTVVGVAILSSATFDAPSMVDKTSLTFGHVGTEASLITCSAKALDVNGDGLKDLICYFDVNKAGFQHGDTVGYLNGLTQLGDAIHGSDMVKITP